MTLVLVFIELALAWATYRFFKQWYVGFGWLLDYDKKSQQVYIVSRLLDSPSGRAGVKNKSRLLNYNGIPLIFSSGQEWLQFFESLPKLRNGEERSFLIQEGKEVRSITLRATVIRGPIPYYAEFTPQSQRKFDIVYGIRRCSRTDLYFETRRLNKAWQAQRGL